MAGLCGIASAERRAELGSELDRMIAAQEDLPWHRSERFVAPSGDLALGQVHLGILPVVATSSLCIHGEHDDAFVEVESEPTSRRITIRNDPFGMMPLFYTQVGGTLVFATSVKAVLAHPRVECRLDERGLADLLAFGFLLGDKTLVRGVRCLPGGSRLTFDPGGRVLSTEKVWSIRQLLGGAGSAGRSTLERVEATFRDAVRSRCSGNVQIGVSLSGGLDSRTIAAAIDHHNHRVKTLTVDVVGGADRAIAEQIAERTNGLANHHVVENSADFFSRWPDYVREMVGLTDGMYYDEACVMMPTLDRYRDVGIEVLLRGHGGELARMSEAYEMRVNRHVEACRTQDDLKTQLFRQMSLAVQEEDLPRLLVPEVAAASQGGARASLDEAFAGIDPTWHVVDQVTCLYAEQYLPRQCVPSLAQLRSRVEVRLPFLDREYVAAVLALPPGHRIRAGTHRHLLRRNNPSLLRVTNANTGIWAGAPDLVQRVGSKGFQILKEHFGYERYHHYVDPAAWLRGPLHEAVASVLLDERTRSRGFFQPSAVSDLLATHRNGRGDHSVTLLTLLYLELWRRTHLDEESGTSMTDGAPGLVDGKRGARA